MATSVTQSLFGITPQSIQSERDAALQQQALQFAKLDPFQSARMGLFQGAAQLGSGIVGALGDPAIEQARQRQGMLGGLDMNNPESLLGAARSIQATDPMAAQALVAQANELAGTQAKTSKLKADTQLEADLRAELAALPANATPAEYEAVVLKYGDPDKILSALTNRQNREADRLSREERDKAEHALRIQLAQQAGADRQAIAAMNQEFMRQQADERRRDKQANKTLPASLQKSEDDDFSAIDSAEAVVQDITPIIGNLTPDSKTGKPALDLSRFNNIQFQTQAFFGSSDPEVQRYQELERNLTRFVNESLRLNKGVQTEGDAQRAANEVQAAFSKGSTSSMRKALEELKKVNERAATNRKAQIDRRRSSQGVEPFYSKGTSSSGQSVLDAADAIINRN
jgi:hypothetical protein